MEFPEELLYTEEHHWILVEGDTALIGLTEHIHELLNEVVAVELPEAGEMLDLGNPMAVVESAAEALDVFAPLSGEVLEVNDGLADSPEWVHISPYEDGWLVRLKISAPEELEDLLEPDDYRELLEEE
jgi:glycine cleavage system H protein